jgi:hypothetical protein
LQEKAILENAATQVRLELVVDELQSRWTSSPAQAIRWSASLAMPMLREMMTRESPYAASHKGLRHALGQFQLLAGRTRHDDPDELAALKARGAELSLLLEHHLLAEERYFLAPLRTRAEAAALHDIDDHARIEPRQRADGRARTP